MTFALPVESSSFRRLPIARGSAITILHTGVSARAAGPRLREFLERNPIDLLVSTGFAGSLDRQLRVGDLVFAENFSNADLLEQTGRLSFERAVIGNLFTSSEVIESEAQRSRAAEKSGAIAVDMETEIIARVCGERGVPMLAIRAISDTHAKSFPAPAAVLFDIENQKTNFARLARYLATHPRHVARLIAFSRQIATARAALTGALQMLLAAKFALPSRPND